MLQAAAPKIESIFFDRKGFTDQELIELYRSLLLPRLIEEKMLLLLRQGKLSKWFSGIGQEAIAVGATIALDSSDYILPLHRNLGVFTSRIVPLPRLFAQWQGKQSGFTKGRDRSFHFGSQEHRIIGMISHLGAMLGVADGLALASNLQKSNEIALVFSGDAGTSEGDFHEAVNVAAVWDLPVIFLIENNGYGLSTPSREQFACRQLIDKAVGYGIEGIRVDGNNILEVHSTVRRLAEKMRKDRKPVLLEALTFRMRGHEEASGIKYVPKALMDQWEKKDPVKTFQNYLLEIGLLTAQKVESIRGELNETIDRAWEAASSEPQINSDEEGELKDVYAIQTLGSFDPPEGKRTQKRFISAISDGLRQAMEKDPTLVLMGQDIAEYGGVFKVTEGFVQLFGKERVRNTPLCESAIVGAALGLTLRGHAAMVEMQFADFVSCGFNQIVNNLAKNHYRWGQPVNVTVRMPTGAGVGAGPFHSQSNEGWITHVPGLKVVYPSTPFDAKGLLTASLIEPNPVLYFEHKGLYRGVEGPVPDDYYTLPLSSASVVQEGSDLTIVTYGAGVHWVLDLLPEFSDVSIELIDLRTLLPWDRETVFASVEKTNRCLILHEDTLTGGFGGEIAATLIEEQFEALDAPVLRVGSLDTPVPFSAALEEQFLARSRLKGAIQRSLSY